MATGRSRAAIPARNGPDRSRGRRAGAAHPGGVGFTLSKRRWDKTRIGRQAKAALLHGQLGQYTAGAFAKACRRLGIHRSSGRTGNALDNAPAESFFSTLQHELIDRRAWTTKAQARQEISLWVHGWYNQQRLHSAIGMVPPVEYEHACAPDPYNQPLHD